MSNNIEHEQYKKLLIYKNSPINKDTQLAIINDLFDCFIQYNKDMLFINDGKIGKITSRKVFETMAYMHLTLVFPGVSIKSYDEEKDKYRWNLKIADIFDTLTTLNSFELLAYESDLFAKKQTIIKDNVSKTITVVTNKLHIKEVQEPNIATDEQLEIIEDYKAHFPHFDSLLNLIVDMRLAKNRKSSFVHLRVKSNWGKSFLSGMLQNLQIGFEIDYHNLMNKGANDIAPIQVRNSFVMILDEFNNFSAEMKKLSHDFKFAPKFGMTEKVELYLKILMSAEKSPSFTGGVDDQIVNRVMVMEIEDKVAETLTSRPVYRRYGNAKYMAVLEYYAYQAIKIHLDLYLSMDKFDAHKTADEEVSRAVLLYKMKDVTSLNDEIKSVLTDIIKEILESSEMDINPKFREIRNNIIPLENGIFANNVLIKQPKRTIEIMLKNSVSEGDYKKMKWKLSNIADMLDVVSVKPVFIKGKTVKGVVVNIEEKKDHSQILKSLSENGNLIFN